MKCSFVMMIVVSLILLINSPVVMAGCCRRAVETKLLKEEQNGVNAESDCVRFRSRIRSTIDFFLCIMHNTNHKLSQKCTIILQIHQSTHSSSYSQYYRVLSILVNHLEETTEIDKLLAMQRDASMHRRRIVTTCVELLRLVMRNFNQVMRVRDGLRNYV